jgi:mxaJ protein
MSSVSPKIYLLIFLCGCSTTNEVAQRSVLRVCSDPNNMPFSNQEHQGFENKIVQVIADDLNADVQYTWWAQRRGFIRNTLKACSCDVIIGLPSSMETVATTNPYYRSKYVFVTKKWRNLDITSFDDPRLKKINIGVHVVGDDGASTPPAQALTRRGMITNIHGYSLYGDYRTDSPPSQIFNALGRGEIDIAVVWGPLAGYAAVKDTSLVVHPIVVDIEQPFLPFAYDISMGVRQGDTVLLKKLDAIIEQRKPTIDSILTQFGVVQATPMMLSSK